MGKFLNINDYQSMLYQSRDGVYSIWFEINEVISESDMLKVFILINKYYPNYFFKTDDFITQKKKWEEYVLSDFKYNPTKVNNIHLTMNVFIQTKEDEIVPIEPADEGIEIIYGAEENKALFGIQFYPYIFFDKNSIYLKNESSKIEEITVDQTIAANKNRRILNNFLKDLDILIKGEISSFECGRKISKKHAFKYGIKESALLAI